MDQRTLDRAVKIATKAALRGEPVTKIVWLPPTTATSDPDGSFIITPYEYRSAGDTPPWEE